MNEWSKMVKFTYSNMKLLGTTHKATVLKPNMLILYLSLIRKLVNFMHAC